MIKNEQERQRIGKRIAELRKGKKMTQAELAERSGLGQGHIARLEAGQYGATIDVLSSIAGAMDADIRIVPRGTLSDPMIGSLGTALNKKVTEVFTPKGTE